MTPRLQPARRALRAAIHLGIALLLLTPFVVSPGTIFPLGLGKALWSRTLIEIVFALWAVLALAGPAYRPPRSWVLALLGAGLAVSLLAAFTGVSLQRSLWSTYDRMDGVVAYAHWFALALVLASMLRGAGAWRRLLAANLVASTAVACLALAAHAGLQPAVYGTAAELHAPRLTLPFGNPIYLSAYMLANLLLASGFAARAWLAAPAADSAAGRGALTPRVLWPLAAALHFAVLVLAGSLGGMAGLFAGVFFAALALAVIARARVRRAAVAALILLTLSAAGAGVRFTDPDRIAVLDLPHPVAQQFGKAHLERPSVQSRLAAWRAGLEGFAERPLLGWGPENYIAVFGRYASGYGAHAEPHDRAHGKAVEVAATTGILGLAAYLALWGFVFYALWRAARRAPPPDRALILAAGAALAGALVQTQSLFDTTVGWLQTVLLLGFVVHLETASPARPRLPGQPWRLPERWTGRLGVARPRAVLSAAALALAGAALAVNHAILDAADVRHTRLSLSSFQPLGDGIDAFPPLGNTYRKALIDEVAIHLPRIRDRDPGHARRLLDWAGREARALLRAEPRAWRAHQSLARMYRTAAAFEPHYAEASERHARRARALAPARAVWPAPLLAPGGLEIRALPDGRHELRWNRVPGTGFHRLTARIPPGRWDSIRFSYDPAETSFVTPERDPGEAWRYRIRACRYPRNCGPWAEWPPLDRGTDAEQARD